MVAVPVATPVNIPVRLTEAVVPEELDHAPPGVASARGVVAPMQILVLPVIAAGEAITLIVLVTMQPVPSE
jgi:hypothetical protein